jgi:uncharacterized membrane protein
LLHQIKTIFEGASVKLYRVTVTDKKTGETVLQRVFTKAHSMHSCKGYWQNRGWRVGGVYNVTVETAYVTDWMPFDYNVESIERSIQHLQDLDVAQTEALIERLSAQLATRAATKVGA